jgi:hypothetical protein
MDIALTWFLFEKTGARLEPEKGAAARTARPGAGGRLLCRACRADVTNTAQRIEIAGAHAHQRTNPAGISFDFGCFSDAPGCGQSGPAVSEHSWFPGYRWQVALCRGCREHLGWLFRGEGRFYGLVLDRLVEAPGPRD